MKTIGLIGGTSWVSTIDYYRIINQQVNERLGGNTSAKILLNSVNYGEIVALTMANDWDSITDIICDAAQRLQQAGADCILLCANTMHRIAPAVQAAINIPLLHIAKITAEAVRAASLDNIVLLGTRYTMQGQFYPEAFAAAGINLRIPGQETIERINDSIYNELSRGIFTTEMKTYYAEVIRQAKSEGAGGVILGCTEIPMLIGQADSVLPVFDTTLLHASAAVGFALG